MNIKVFGPVDERALSQLITCAETGDSPHAVLCADHHVGYSQPIGGAVAYYNHISPSGVGFDIGCGNKAVLTDAKVSDINVRNVMDDIVRFIGFGTGRPNPSPIYHEVLDKIEKADFAPQRKLIDKAAKQLGTVGSGNHYVDIFADEQDRVWVGVHFGSRGFGHLTASGFLALAQGFKFEDKVKEGGMDSPPILLSTEEQIGQDYVAAMNLAGEYAYAGRDIVCEKVLEILGARALDSVHNHHNFAWRETHDGEEVWVVRKGCTPAFPGQKGFVGATMAEPSCILEGVDSEESRESLYSTVHGAGRRLSRSQAAGSMRKVKGRLVRQRDGVVHWGNVLADMQEKGIVLRGAAADEAPEAYKRLDEVLSYHGDTIRVLHWLRPLGVAMAGPDIHDPYRD